MEKKGFITDSDLDVVLKPSCLIVTTGSLLDLFLTKFHLDIGEITNGILCP